MPFTSQEAVTNRRPEVLMVLVSAFGNPAERLTKSICKALGAPELQKCSATVLLDSGEWQQSWEATGRQNDSHW